MSTYAESSMAVSRLSSSSTLRARERYSSSNLREWSSLRRETEMHIHQSFLCTQFPHYYGTTHQSHLHHGRNFDTNLFKLHLVFIGQLVRVKSDQSQTEAPILEVIDQLMQVEEARRKRKVVLISTVVKLNDFCLCCYLLVRLEGPVILDARITEVLHLP